MFWWSGLPLIVLLALPLVGLLLAAPLGQLAAGFSHPLFGAALALSVRTSMISLTLIVVFGTPLAWWLARAPQRSAWNLLIDLPMVLPPAVVGLALLLLFGRQGALASLGGVAFTSVAVILAQTIVAAPFYLQSASAAFRSIDADLVLVARSLGADSKGAFLRVALPLAMPGLISGAALAWARALGEFGATLFFAGNLAGVSQTMPLAIYTALETDVRAALALALMLAAAALALLAALRLVPRLWVRE